MTTPAESEPHPADPDDGAGVLANLPRARPQRATPRRAAARERAAGTRSTGGGTAESGTGSAAPGGKRAASASAGERKAAPKPRSQTTARAKPRSPTKARPKAAPRRARRADEEPVPRQGFAGDDDRARGPVQPPGGPELLAGAAEIVSELAKAGAGAGERLVRDILSRLPGS